MNTPPPPRASHLIPFGRREGVIIIVTEQMLGSKPAFKRLCRKARFALCQMLLRPGEEGQQTRRRFGRNLCVEHE